MLASGRSRKVAWFGSVLLGLGNDGGCTPHGAVPAPCGFGVAAGCRGTIYVAASDLIPRFNREPGVKMALVVFVGVAMVFGLDRVFHGH